MDTTNVFLTVEGELCEALQFARSVIKSGEPWTAKCEEVIDGAISRKALSDTAPASLCVFQDGNMWCALYGENLQEGQACFGETPMEAVKGWFGLYDVPVTKEVEL